MKKPVIVNLLVFSISALVFGTQPSSADNNAICETPACVHAASRLIRMRNPSVEPCNDFYEFACGGVSNLTQSTIKINRFIELRNEFGNKLEQILEQGIAIDDFKYLKLAKTLYKICANKSFDLFINSMEPSGGWPVLKGSQWDENAFDYKNTVFTVDNTTILENYFFKIGLHVDNRSITVEPYPSELNADPSFQGFSKTIIYDYYNKMIKYAQALNAPVSNPDYKNDLDNLVAFESQLGSARLSIDRMWDPTFDTVEMTLYDLEKNYPLFNWKHIHLLGYPVDSSTTFIIKNFSYMKNLQDLLNSAGIKRTLANYVMWKHLRNYDKLSLLLTDHNYCVPFVSYTLPIAVGAIYLQSYNHSRLINADDKILQMASSIKEEFLGMIQEADWIDPETEKEVVKKLQSSKNILGYINEFTNNSKINEYHEDFELFDENNFFDSATRIALKLMKLTPDDYIWYNNALNMLAYSPSFDPLSNSILISYEMFESEFFNLEQPDYINYGAVGISLGHEIAHGFDSNGKKFDAEGHLNDTWTPTSTENFNNKSKCFIEQYSNYRVKELGLNSDGGVSQGEIISDHGGMKAVYRAYNKLSDTHKRLPGLFYTSKQMFWISYANTWCEKKTTPEQLKSQIVDVHPPNKFRVIGTLSNMPEFASDFKCSSGSNMNPVNKCSVW